MNERSLKTEEDEEIQSLISDRSTDSSLWHYQPIKGLTFVQELIVISVVTVLGCVFTLTRLDLETPHLNANNDEPVETKFSSSSSMGMLASIGTVEDRFLPGLETPSLVRRFSSEKSSLEWFESYPHPSPDGPSKTHTDFISDSSQENISEKRADPDLADTDNLREMLKLIAGDIYAHNANSSPDQYQIPEKWQTDLQGNEVVYKRYNQNSAVVYSSNANEENQGPDNSRPFYALIWPPNHQQVIITASVAAEKSSPAPKQHIVSTKKKIEIKKPLEIGQIPQSLDTIQPSPKDESPQKKRGTKKENLIPMREETRSPPSDFPAPIPPVAEKKETPSPTIQITRKNLSPQVPQASKRPEVQGTPVQKSTSINPKDSLIDKIAALNPEDISHLTRGEMKEAHLVWFTQSIRKLLSEAQLKVIPREQWIYLSDAQIHRMSAEMRNSLGLAIGLFQPERVEKIFSISQIESFLEANIDVPEALSALTERMNAKQIAGISNAHFSVIVHWLNPTQISFARPEQIAMLSLEAYARLDFLQRAAFTPLQRAAEANIVFPNAGTKSPENTINLILSGLGEKQKAIKKTTKSDIEDLNRPDPVQKKFSAPPPPPLPMNLRSNNPALSISEIRAMQTDRVREIAPQQIYAVTVRGHIHYFSEVQIQAFTSRQINSAISSTRKNGELAYLIHRLTPVQIKMISPRLCDRIYLDWIPENGRKGLSPQQLAALRIGDPAYLSSLTDKQLSNLSLDQIILTGKKGGIQHLSNRQIHTMTSAQITAFISEVTNSDQLAYLVHRLTAHQIKTLAPDLTEQIYLDWIPENVRHTLSPEQITTIRIGDPKHLSSLTREQLRLFDSKKLAEIEKKGGVKYLSQVLSNERIAALNGDQPLFKEDARRNIALAFLTKELHPNKNKGPLPAFDTRAPINTENKKLASLVMRSD